MTPSQSFQPTGNQVLLGSVLTIWVWIGLAAWLNQSQINDSLEPYIWAQSFEWGYWKHPPLTTWLMYVSLHWVGPSPYWPYVLSGLTYAVTVWASHRIARLLFDLDIAAWVALLLTLHYGFTRRAQLYNHNSVLVAFIALTAWVTLLALRDQKYRLWLGAGLLGGLSLLVKYQAAVPLAGIVVAVLATHHVHQVRKGLAWAMAVAALVFAPHLLWAHQHDFEPFRYALRYVDANALDDPVMRQGAFWVNQLRYHLPMLFFALCVWTIGLVRRSTGPDKHEATLSLRQKLWLGGLLVLPLGFIVFISLAMGARVQSHWGLQASQFMVLAVAFWMWRKQGPIATRHLWVWVVVQMISMSIFAAQGLGLIRYDTQRQAVRSMPAESMTTQAMAFWATRTHCPLKYLAGDAAMGAMMSAYSGQRLKVLEDSDPRKSPWIDLQQMQKDGFLALSVRSSASTDADTLDLPYRLNSHGPMGDEFEYHLQVQYHAPTLVCDIDPRR